VPPPAASRRRSTTASNARAAALVGICLPDEVAFLQRGLIQPRPLAVARDDALPLYVQTPGARVRKSGDTLEITVEDAPPTRARLIEVSQLVLIGNAGVTTPACTS
jgi:CRISPR-associated protein Cas1